MTAGLLVRHQGRPDGEGIEMSLASSTSLSGTASARRGRNLIAHQRSLAVPPVGVETITDHRPPIAHLIGDHRDDRTGHLRKIDIGIRDRRGDRHGLFADVEDAQGRGPFDMTGYAPEDCSANADGIGCYAGSAYRGTRLARRFRCACRQRQLLARRRNTQHHPASPSAAGSARWRIGSAHLCSYARPRARR